jgi:hypothetical protein
MAALDHMCYSAHGLYFKPKANMNNFFNINRDEINEGYLMNNILDFRKINNL